ncbi:MAG: tRNA (adenosine(37)-N6)-threonylcarbamoyltransferase complex ATPase subunit type 1 TsaE [Candidatus Binatus sp.]|jgi:tRNA threonylcarbamoyladenosine biosynthesis protein TsaE|uniref:tRNA (adenosine(37)-N6)-threonylcarbamoyltransferase complex ATPase subunit type 1 TsaE n=1 Tax=Candidatus Binatus sp. TaxID=2811406 RepID=UPI003C8F4926
MANEAVESGASVVTMVIESRSPHETKSWGRRLASLLEGGELLGLIGDLGAGKTCFIKGLARGLNLREEDILSPTFTMIQEHHGRLPLYHIDLYRLEEATLDDLGLREYLFSEGIAAVEWFERLRGGAEMEYLAVRISYAGANIRRIEFSAVDSRHAQIISKLKRRFA